jgi:hypothetical protein
MKFFKKTVNNLKEKSKIENDLKTVGTILKNIFGSSESYEFAEKVINDYFVRITNQTDKQKFYEFSLLYDIYDMFNSETLRTDTCTFDEKKVSVIIEYIHYEKTNEIIFILNKSQQKLDGLGWYNSHIEIFAYNPEKLLKTLSIGEKNETV